MPEKKERFLPIKEMVFTFLAISKIMYWITVITGLEQQNLGSIGQALVYRLLERDLMLILGILLFYGLDKLLSKKFNDNNFVMYIIIYVIFYAIMIAFGYAVFGIISLFMEVGTVAPLLETLRSTILPYIAVIVALNLKMHFKAKGKDTLKDMVLTSEKEKKINLLKSMLDDGILTQEEFDRKKALV